MMNAKLEIRNSNREPSSRNHWIALFAWTSITCALSCLHSSYALADDTKGTGAKNPITVTTIPNPARGKKMSFRVMSAGPCKVRIKIYNRFFDPVAKLEQEGDHLFDIIWSLKNIPEGPYLYQVLVDDKTSGETTKLPQQKFWVMKDEPSVPKAKNPKPKSSKN